MNAGFVWLVLVLGVAADQPIARPDVGPVAGPENCLQRRKDVVKYGLPGVWVPRCGENGAYAGLQIGVNGPFCVDVFGATIVPPTPGLIACECPRVRSQARHEFQQAEGMLGMFVPNCDADGTYSMLQYDGRSALTGMETAVKCFTREGEEIMKGSHIQSCKCPVARFTALLEQNAHPDIGPMWIPQCNDITGHFRARQTLTGRFPETGPSWCVDENGQNVGFTRTQKNYSDIDCELPVLKK